MSEDIDSLNSLSLAPAGRRLPDQPLGWGKVALAVLPGIFAFGCQLGLGRYLNMDYPVVMWSMAALCVVVCVAGLVLERKLAAWSFPALGVLVSPGMFGVVTLFNGQSLNLWQTQLLLVGASSILPILIGLLLARRSGLLAGLFFVGVAYAFWAGIGDPGYALELWTTNRLLTTFVSTCPELFFLILVPIGVLRSSSPRVRWLWYVAPISLALVITAAISAAVRPYSIFAWTIGWDFAFILLPLVLALGLYSWIGRKGLRAKTPA